MLWGSVLSSIPRPSPHDVLTLGPSQSLGGHSSHRLDLPCSLRWSNDSQPIYCDSEPLFPLRSDCHSRCFGAPFCLRYPPHHLVTLGPSRTLFWPFSRALNLPWSPGWSYDSQPLHCDLEPLSLAFWPPFRCFQAPVVFDTPAHYPMTSGPSRALGGLFDHLFFLPCSLRWSG